MTRTTKTKTIKTLSPIARLAAAADRARKLTPRRHPAPIAACVRVHVWPVWGSTRVDVQIEATDYDTWTSEVTADLSDAYANTPHQLSPKGRQLMVDAAALYAAVKTAAALKDDRVGVQVTPGGPSADPSIMLRVGPTLLPAPLNPADYQPAPAMDDTRSVWIYAPDLPHAIAATRGCASTEETRYYLNGVCVRTSPAPASPNSVDVVATDGHRLARYACPASLRVSDLSTAQTTPRVDIIIPSGALDALQGATRLRTDGQLVSALIGSRHVVARLIAGTFPEYERVIPPRKSNDKTVVHAGPVDVDALSAAAAGAVRVAGKNARVRWAEEAIQTTGEAQASIPAPGAAPPGNMTIGVNASYLKDIAAPFGVPGADATRGRVLCYMTDAGSPMLFERGALSYVVMPMRIKN